MDLKMRTTKREEGYVAGSPWTNTQGRNNITHSTDPNMQERKRRADDGGEMPRKRMRCGSFISSDELHEGSVENENVQGFGRKACADAGASEKTTRRHISSTATTDASVVDDDLVGPKKRKATDDDEAPQRKRSRNISDSLQVNEASDDNDDDEGAVSQNVSWASVEEEWIYQLSSPQCMRRAGFKENYLQFKCISTGGLGSVYAGIRRSDQLPVAIKHIPTESVTYDEVTCNGRKYVIIPEVAFMLKAAGPPGSAGQSAVVSLLDCYIERAELILIMERPAKSMDLGQFLHTSGGHLDECEAKMILKQVVDAASDMHSKGVFHRDIKAENVLIQMDSDVPRVRIIDFGSSTFSTDVPYSDLAGTPALFPPECFSKKSYWARATSVWQLGALFYRLLTGRLFTLGGFLINGLKINYKCSTEVQTLLNLCLAEEPLFRVTLDSLQHKLDNM